MTRVFLDHDGKVLAGTVGLSVVHLELDVPNSRSGLRGWCIGHAVDGYWQVESNAGNDAPAARFLGRHGDEPVTLEARFQLGRRTSLSVAELAGSMGERELSARIAPVEAPSYGPTVVGVDGTFDGATITLYASMATGRDRECRLEGSIGGQRVHLVARPSPSGRTVRRSYDAPPELFALLVGALLYFP